MDKETLAICFFLSNSSKNASEELKLMYNVQKRISIIARQYSSIFVDNEMEIMGSFIYLFIF